jgi:hypothetical protein
MRPEIRRSSSSAPQSGEKIGVERYSCSSASRSLEVYMDFEADLDAVVVPCLVTLPFLPFAEATRAEVNVSAGFVGALETDGTMGDIEVTCTVS